MYALSMKEYVVESDARNASVHSPADPTRNCRRGTSSSARNSRQGRAIAVIHRSDGPLTSRALDGRAWTAGTTIKRLFLVALLGAAPIQLSIQDGPLGVRLHGAAAQTAAVSAKEAFEAARALGTAEAWEAFLKSYPAGFY